MEYQKAIAVLKNLMEKKSLSEEEKEAVLTALGVLSLGSLAMSKIKAQKTKRDSSAKW
jgi:hypothetical protein